MYEPNEGLFYVSYIYDRSPISRVTIPEAVVIQLVRLMMSSVPLETC